MDNLRKAALKDLRYDLSLITIGRPKNHRLGLCGNVRIGTAIKGYLADTMARWYKFSGNLSYPVPAYYGSGPYEAARMYLNVGCNAGDMYSGEYGKLRLELAQFIIDRIDEELKGYVNQQD